MQVQMIKNTICARSLSVHRLILTCLVLLSWRGRNEGEKLPNSSRGDQNVKSIQVLKIKVQLKKRFNAALLAPRVGAQLMCVSSQPSLYGIKQTRKKNKQKRYRPLNNVILRCGNTRASEDLHFPQVEATVHVHLVTLVSGKTRKQDSIIVID